MRSGPVNTSLLPYQLLHDEAIERLHVASTRILSEMGIEFQDEEICAMLRASGAEVKGQIARFDPALVESLIAKAPRQKKPAQRTRAGRLRAQP